MAESVGLLGLDRAPSRTSLSSLLSSERRVYNPTVVPATQRRPKSRCAPLAEPEEFDSAQDATAASSAAPTTSSDSGCWTPSLELGSSLSTTQSASGRETPTSATTLDHVSVVDARLVCPTSDGLDDRVSFEALSPARSTISVGGDDLEDGEDSLDGKVKTVVDVPVNLSFQDLSLTVHRRIRLKRVTRRILDGVSGEFRAGQLSAIMGPSGAGKSSLMGVLTGFTPRGVSGQLLVNGATRDAWHFRRQSVYIQQDAPLFPQLTVKEAMHVAAHLKLGDTGEAARRTILDVLESLGLSEHQATMTGRLSGGQLKRLAIAMELINNPPVLFFDEPTSGLDSSSTRQCVMLLQRLARQGRTVICTIHQPSASVFALLDQLYLLVDGRCAYRGAITNLVGFFGNLGLHCPAYHNPADYALEVTSGEYGDHAAALVGASDNGSREDWVSRRKPILPAQWPSAASDTASAGGGTALTFCSSPRIYSTSFWIQLLVLTKRALLRALRDPMLCHSRLYTHLIMGLLIGVLFHNIGGDAAHVFHNFSLLFFCLMFLMFTAFSATSLAFPLEMNVIAREHFNRWYSLKSYFLAVTVADVPVQGMCTLVYSLVVYYMTSQPLEPARYLQFLLMCALVAYVAQSIGLIIGAALKVQHAVIFGPLMILPFTIFSGYFVHQKDAPAGLRWLFHASFLKYGLEGVMLAVYGGGRAQLGCSEDYCHFIQPNKFLSSLDLDAGNYWADAGVLLALGSALRLLAFFVLKYRLKLFR